MLKRSMVAGPTEAHRASCAHLGLLLHISYNGFWKGGPRVFTQNIGARLEIWELRQREFYLLIGFISVVVALVKLPSDVSTHSNSLR